MKRYAFLVRGSTDQHAEISDPIAWNNYLVIAHTTLEAFDLAFAKAQTMDEIELQAMTIVQSTEVD